DFLQALDVQDGKFSAHVADNAGLLQGCGCKTHRGAVNAQHSGQKFMRQGQLPGVSTVVAYQRPSSQPLFYGVDTVAKRRLRNLADQPLYIAQKQGAYLRAILKR